MAVWVSSAGQLIDLGICDYYESGNRCHSRDGAISVFYYAVAPATVALFSMGQTRLSALISFVIWLIVIIITLATASSEFAKNSEYCFGVQLRVSANRHALQSSI